MLRLTALGFCSIFALHSALAADTLTPLRLPPTSIAVLDEAVANSREWLANADRAALVFIQEIESADGDKTERRVLQVDRRRPAAAQSELLSVDGQPPDKRALKQFHKQQKKRAHRKADDDDGTVTISLARFDTRDARLVGREGDLLVFAVPNGARSIMTGEKQARLAENLAMQVHVDPRHPAGPFLRTVELVSTTPFKPGWIGKVDHFNTQWVFDLLEPGHLLVVHHIATDVEARALFQDFIHHERITFKEYEIHPLPDSGVAGSGE